MEGFKYMAPGPGNSMSSTKNKPMPAADFSTPEDRLGVIPRAVSCLFDSVGADTSRRFNIRCSFVQIYKEQAYDLLNPTSIVMAGGAESQRRNAKPGQVAAGALRMRWSKTEDFYLENLFKVECGSAEEVMNAFKHGVQNKMMASHRLNAASSRSHCLFTLYIDSSPMGSPNEVISSRLSLVDLAGSERGSSTGATEGRLRDESVAINKSLFTLRQVITCLTTSQAHADAAATAQAAGGPAPPPGFSHIPYRDSKLTQLLKNSLGGNSLTMMIACLAPVDTFYEENLSTLDYASRTKRITNQVAVNEDPKTKLIRELRAEVAFLRHQLAVLQGTQPGVAAMMMQGSGPGPGSGTKSGIPQAPRAGGSRGGPP
eukprot:CAMPEP_0202918878 /NCGR_PEP_ID=MMETSP1392-20130828/74439_1 /ASSEMBLY_ACC=CAM_ASM_000868 /TAXON_ID=225041 /ORGANISM="Chlamydomonas chlamydogama, Strain SAG 11-48b" /LENGTH=371 /DNA_ID=CAMNT_0049612047 /DNA_START=68 /DNA_END=1180 /DNA_ORIENTATION=-